MRSIVVVVLAVLLIGVSAFAGCSALSHAEAYAAEPADGAAVSAAAIARAEHWGEQAIRNLRLLNRARACFGWPALRLIPPRIVVDLPGAGDFWKAKATDYYRRFLRLRWRMAHPGAPYCAADWRPLVRWHWPAACVPQVIAVINRESCGVPTVGSTFRGLMQIWWRHAPSVNLYDPDANIAAGYRLWRRCGWGPWR